ncbi:MAG: hypothetical protein ABI721_03725 [Candidatus Dojkabacteria bacterium]
MRLRRYKTKSKIYFAVLLAVIILLPIASILILKSSEEPLADKIALGYSDKIEIFDLSGNRLKTINISEPEKHFDKLVISPSLKTLAYIETSSSNATNSFGFSSAKSIGQLSIYNLDTDTSTMYSKSDVLSFDLVDDENALVYNQHNKNIFKANIVNGSEPVKVGIDLDMDTISNDPPLLALGDNILAYSMWTKPDGKEQRFFYSFLSQDKLISNVLESMLIQYDSFPVGIPYKYFILAKDKSQNRVAISTYDESTYTDGIAYSAPETIIIATSSCSNFCIDANHTNITMGGTSKGKFSIIYNLAWIGGKVCAVRGLSNQDSIEYVDGIFCYQVDDNNSIVNEEEVVSKDMVDQLTIATNRNTLAFANKGKLYLEDVEQKTIEETNISTRDDLKFIGFMK